MSNGRERKGQGTKWETTSADDITMQSLPFLLLFLYFSCYFILFIYSLEGAIFYPIYILTCTALSKKKIKKNK